MNKDIIASSALLTKLRCSPRKVNLVTQLIRGKEADEAIRILRFCRKAVAADILKLLISAVYNAKEKMIDIDSLYVSEAHVGKDICLKRFHARARGRGNRIEKPFSRVRISLSIGNKSKEVA